MSALETIFFLNFTTFFLFILFIPDLFHLWEFYVNCLIIYIVFTNSITLFDFTFTPHQMSEVLILHFFFLNALSSSINAIMVDQPKFSKRTLSANSIIFFIKKKNYWRITFFATVPLNKKSVRSSSSSPQQYGSTG